MFRLCPGFRRYFEALCALPRFLFLLRRLQMLVDLVVDDASDIKIFDLTYLFRLGQHSIGVRSLFNLLLLAKPCFSLQLLSTKRHQTLSTMCIVLLLSYASVAMQLSTNYSQKVIRRAIALPLLLALNAGLQPISLYCYV